jgi:hypothetical protein
MKEVNKMARERTGSIVNRDGVLYARVSYVDEFGKRREVTRKAVDRADARRIIDELHARLDQHGGGAVINDRATLADVIEAYRKEKAAPAVVRDGKKIAGLKSSYNFGLMLDVLIEYFGFRTPTTPRHQTRRPSRLQEEATRHTHTIRERSKRC